MFTQVVQSAIEKRFVSLQPESPEVLAYSSGIMRWLQLLEIEDIAPFLVYRRSSNGGLDISLDEEIPNPNGIRVALEVTAIQETTIDSSRTVGADVLGSLSSTREDLPVKMVSLGIGYRIEPSPLIPDALAFLYANEVFENSHVSILPEGKMCVRKERMQSKGKGEIQRVGEDCTISKSDVFEELKKNVRIIKGE